MTTQDFKYIFLDRDGVINVERPNDYAKEVSEFVFIHGAIEAISMLTKLFDKLFIITNQRGVGRGVMSEDSLQSVHDYMNSAIENQGGKIDKIYYCTDLTNSSINRKPNIGMAFQAKADYPMIDFKQSIMVGNSLSDIQFGNKVGMYTVLVGDKYPENHNIYDMIDKYYENLHMFAKQIKQK